jgi:ferredoxin
VAPETFQLDDENKAYVLERGLESGGRSFERELEVTDEEYEKILLSAQSCPTLAVIICDENGKQIFPEE